MSNSQKKIYEYQPSQQVTQAKPGDYSSRWQAKAEDTLGQIAGRKDFSYDVNGDALYDQYKDQYIRQGKLAMADTMGQAAALTGGYGSSYGQTVGGQVYQGYMQQLADKVPELSRLAYDRYQQEGQDMKDLYALYRDMEAQDYGRYRDSVSDYLTERDFDYGQHRDQVADSQYKEQFDYQKGRDEVADYQWQQQYGESVRQYNEQFGYQKEQNWAQLGARGRYEEIRKRARSSEDPRILLDHMSTLSSTEIVETLQAYAENNDTMGLETFLDDCEIAEILTPEQVSAYREQYEGIMLSVNQYKNAKNAGNEVAALEHVSSMSSEELVDILQGYADNGDNLGLETFLSDCVATGRMTIAQKEDLLEAYGTEDDLPEQVDTTVQTTTAPPAPVLTPPVTGNTSGAGTTLIPNTVSPGSANRPTVSPTVVGGTERERQESQANRLRDRVNIKI